MHWYKFNIGDYLTDTMHLADAEDLAYRRLIDLYYMSERPIPLDVAFVARKIRLDQDVTELVLGEFFVMTDDGYRHDRCDKEIARYSSQVEKNKVSAKLGGRPKKTELESESDPNRNPNKIKKKNKTPPTPLAGGMRFIEFWACWPSSPRKVGKASCEKKWVARNLDSLADQIIGHVEALKNSQQWREGFEPAPLTYINQSRWQDAAETDAPLMRRVI